MAFGTPTTIASTRIPPLEPPYADDVERSLTAMMGSSGREPLALFRTMLQNFEAGDRIRPLGSYFLTRGTLDARERELVIHRVTARLGAEYEWGVHAALFARPLGLPDEWVDATAGGDASSSAFTEREKLLIRFADELCDTASVSDALWAAMRPHWTDPQFIELLMLAGWYHLISFVCNGARLSLEPWARRFPTAA